jgi:paraquat-inducible protein A
MTDETQPKLSLISCPDCGVIQRMPAPPSRGRLECWKCGHTLEQTSWRSLDAALACSLATLLLLVPANFMHLMTVHVDGISTSTHLAGGIGVAWQQGWPVVAVVLILQAVLLPFVRFSLLSVTLTAVRFHVHGGWVGPAFRYCQILDRWAMADVVAIGFGVGYGRVASQIPVRIDIGGWCFLAAAIMTLVTRAAIERRAIWREIATSSVEPEADAIACTSCNLVVPAATEGQPCPRCRALVYRRRPVAFVQSMALVSACWVLMPVAYWLPMSAFWEAGTPHPHSIIDGVILLFDHGFWPLGILICLTSVGIPFGKLIGLTWFLVAITRNSNWKLRRKTQVYRLIDEIGRWSNLDPFTVMIFSPMVQFGQLAHIDVMGGSLAFLSMVVLSMIAARAFDPRLMWDAAEAEASAAVPQLQLWVHRHV